MHSKDGCVDELHMLVSCWKLHLIHFYCKGDVGMYMVSEIKVELLKRKNQNA